MRYSTSKDDPGQVAWGQATADGWSVHVFLGGSEMQDVTTADSDEGFLLRAKRDVNGVFVVENDEIQIERLEGAVTFELRPRAHGRWS